MEKNIVDFAKKHEHEIIWHFHGFVPNYKEVLVAKMKDGSFRCDNTVNMILCWSKVVAWVKVEEIKKLMAQ